MLTRKCQSILYVDDDPDICEVVQATLCLIAGLDVHTANSGERAIDLAYEHRPDLILMDVMMPGLDGPATLKRMRHSALIGEIPLIFLTAKVLPAEIAQFLKLGAIGVIGKPFDPLKLGDQLFALWEGRNSAREAVGTRDGKAQVRTQVNSLAASFLARTRSDAIRLTKIVDRVRTGDWSKLKDAERIGHSIHGAGAMFGFLEVSAAGRAIEDFAGEVMASHPASNSALDPAILHLLACTERLADEVETAWQRTPSQGDARHLPSFGR